MAWHHPCHCHHLYQTMTPAHGWSEPGEGAQQTPSQGSVLAKESKGTSSGTTSASPPTASTVPELTSQAQAQAAAV